MRRDAFVGRREELRALSERYEAGTHLITLVAAGGVGKTRLAQRFAAGESGAVFVDLSEARAPDDVLRITAAALDVSLASAPTEEDAVAAIGRDLRARGRALLVLDNFEQVLPSARFVGSWLDAAPAARFLATSRERLRVDGELVFALAPFATDASEISFGDDAVELFMLRAEAIGATLPRDRETLALVGAIARQLDGIPLAIELAAARASVIGPRQIRERLERGVPDFGRRPRDDDTRHTTMRAAIAWSWELLDANERAVLGEASVFRGGFSADAAEAVIDCDEAVLDVLTRLVEKSLLTSTTCPGFQNEVRLGMFVTVRDFAEEQLGPKEVPTWRRHALHAVAEAEAWAARVHEASGAELLARLSLEEENLLAVVERSRTTLDTALGIRALLALEPLRTGQAPSPYLLALDGAVARVDGALELSSPELVAALFLARAQCKRWAGRTTDALADLERSLALSRTSESPRSELKALSVLGQLEVVAGRFDQGLAHQRRARELALGCGELRLAARLHLDERTSEHQAGRLSGRDAIVPVLPELEAEGDVEAVAHAETRLGMFLIDEGRYADARTALESSLAFFRGRRDRRREAWLQRTLASLDLLELDLVAAERNARQALSVETTMGLGYGVANARLVLGSVLLDAGALREAVEHLEGAVEGLRALRDGRHGGVALARLGRARAQAGELAIAERAFADAEVALAPLGDKRFSAVLEMERGHLDLLLARRALEAGESDAAAAHIEAARARLPSVASSGFDKLTEAVLAARALRASINDLAPPDDALVIAEDGSWFRPPGGDPVSIVSRPTLARILRALLEARIDGNGTPLGVVSLANAGWPNQKILPAAAQNRVNVALTTLRKLGLGEVVSRVDDGWRLNERVPIVRRSTASSGA